MGRKAKSKKVDGPAPRKPPAELPWRRVTARGPHTCLRCSEPVRRGDACYRVGHGSASTAGIGHLDRSYGVLCRWCGESLAEWGSDPGAAF
jgi:hypothetical protein